MTFQLKIDNNEGKGSKYKIKTICNNAVYRKN